MIKCIIHVQYVHTVVTLLSELILKKSRYTKIESKGTCQWNMKRRKL